MPASWQNLTSIPSLVSSDAEAAVLARKKALQMDSFIAVCWRAGHALTPQRIFLRATERLSTGEWLAVVPDYFERKAAGDTPPPPMRLRYDQIMAVAPTEMFDALLKGEYQGQPFRIMQPPAKRRPRTRQATRH